MSKKSGIEVYLRVRPTKKPYTGLGTCLKILSHTVVVTFIQVCSLMKERLSLIFSVMDFAQMRLKMITTNSSIMEFLICLHSRKQSLNRSQKMLLMIAFRVTTALYSHMVKQVRVRRSLLQVVPKDTLIVESYREL